MSSNEMVEILAGELERLIKTMPETEVGTEKYSALIQQMSALRWEMTALREMPVELDHVPVVPRPNIDPVIPVPDPAPVVVTPAVDWSEYRTALRGELTAARNNGLDMHALLQKIGCCNYSSVPDERLPELRELLEAAVKEKS